MIGTDSLVASRSCEILVRHDPPEPHTWTVGSCQRVNGKATKMHGRTLVEYGEDALDIGVDLGRGCLCGAGEVALGNVAGRGARDERAGQRLPPHVLVIGATVNVYHIAGAMLHFLHSLRSDGEQWSLRIVEPPARSGGCLYSAQNGERSSQRMRKAGWVGESAARGGGGECRGGSN